MSEEKNQLRFSIDVRSLKQHNFTAQLYFVYQALPELNIKKFRSAPSQTVPNAKINVPIENCFKSYLFEANRKQLKEKFCNILEVELWHKNTNREDEILGLVKVQLEHILKQPFRKTKESYAVQYDVLLPVEEIDADRKPIKQIGVVQTVVYLQDLGPVNMLKQKGFDIKNFIDDMPLEKQDEQRIFNNDPPAISNEKYGSLSENKKIQLNDLEQKVVWELQVWKKNEEARTRIILKQKQAEFWGSLCQEQRKSDIEKQKHFKKMEANLSLQENKIKAKMNQLIKREQKIIVFEQEIQSKISEVSREVFLKDEEIERMKKRFKEEKTVMIKEKSNLQLEMSKLRADNARLKVQLEQARKQDEKAPINILKNQLSHKVMEIKELRRQLENCMQIKEEFKLHYERMKAEVIDKKEQLDNKQRQVYSLEKDNEIYRHTIKQREEQIAFLRQQQYYQQHNAPANQGYQSDDEPEYNSEKQRLVRKRKELIERNHYPLNDPLILQYDRRISELG